MGFDLQNKFRRESHTDHDRIVDQWRVGERLGRGTFGTVYLARDTTTGERVALKIFDEDFDSNGYLRELGLMFDEQHPNIVEIISFGYTSGQKYIVYEYVGGGNLRDYLVSEKRVSPLKALRILSGAAEGLQFAHECDVVHRDLKPENLLLTSPEWPFTVKICDFGLSARATKGHELDATYGSPAYMAPEQFKGAYDHRVDFYSVGVILYEMLFGRRPLSGDASTISHAHETCGVQLPDRGSPGIRRLMRRTLASDPDDRFETAAELVAAFEEVTERLEEGRESARIEEPGTRQLQFHKQWAARIGGEAPCAESTREGALQLAVEGRLAALTPDGELFELAEVEGPVDDIVPGGTANATVAWRSGRDVSVVHQGERADWELPDEIVERIFELRLDPRGELIVALTDNFVQVHRWDGEPVWRATIETYGTLPAFCFSADGSRVWLSTEEPRTQLFCLDREGDPMVRTTAPTSDFALCAIGGAGSVTVASHGKPSAYRVDDEGYIEREVPLFEPAAEVSLLQERALGVASVSHMEVLDGETLESRCLVKFPSPEVPQVIGTSGLYKLEVVEGETNVEYWSLERRGPEGN